ncbi:MAG: sigma-70 family RNA polymerase sigma factor [Clostridiales bacterium]|nr:sigma-70 family RNA polymerase sigma factor [Clostridiales bacterium]
MLRSIGGRCGLPYDEIEDAVQESFLSYYAHYPLTWPDSHIKAILAKIMKNRCIDYLKKKGNQVVDFQSSGDLEMLLVENDWLRARDTLDVVMEKMLIEDFREVLNNMREDWKQVYISYEFQGKSMREISSQLGISENACRMRHSRGKKYLAAYMRNHNRELSGRREISLQVTRQPSDA